MSGLKGPPKQARVLFFRACKNVKPMEYPHNKRGDDSTVCYFKWTGQDMAGVAYRRFLADNTSLHRVPFCYGHWWLVTNAMKGGESLKWNGIEWMGWKD